MEKVIKSVFFKDQEIEFEAYVENDKVYLTEHGVYQIMLNICSVLYDKVNPTESKEKVDDVITPTTPKPENKTILFTPEQKEQMATIKSKLGIKDKTQFDILNPIIIKWSSSKINQIDKWESLTSLSNEEKDDFINFTKKYLNII